VITEVFVSEGEQVRAGQPVARVHSLQTELRYRQVKGDLERARRDEAAHRADGELSAAQLAATERATLEQELQLLERELEATTLRAPFAGVVMTPHLNQRMGEHIGTGEQFCEIGGLDSLRVELSLPERDWHLVTIGSEVRLKFYTFAERTFKGQVDNLSPVARDNLEGVRVLTLTTVLREPPANLRPNMTGVGKVTLGSRSLLWHLSRPFRRFFAIRWWS
jgi:multidrug resistance efflux pump